MKALIFLILPFFFIMSVSANVDMNVFVQNHNISLATFDLNLLYVNAHNRYSTDPIRTCNYLFEGTGSVSVTDSNGGDDVETVSWSRNGIDWETMTIEQSKNLSTYAHDFVSWIVLNNELITLLVTASDGESSDNESYNRTILHANCQRTIDHDVKLEEAYIEEFNFLNTTYYLGGSGTGKTMLTEYYNDSRINDTVFEFVSTTGIRTDQLIIIIPTNNTDAKGISLWNSSEWVLLNQSGIANGTAWGITNTLGEFKLETKNIPQRGGCTTKWKCTKWSDCENGLQTRTCVDINCGRIYGVPNTNRICELEKDDDKNPSYLNPERRGKDVLFDIYMDIIKNKISQGDHLIVKIGLINFGESGNVFAHVTSTITNQEGIIVYEDTEQQEVLTQIEYLKDYDLTYLRPGTYHLQLDLSYEGQTEPASASADFTVQGLSSLSIMLIVLVCLAGISLLVAFIVLKRSKRI